MRSRPLIVATALILLAGCGSAVTSPSPTGPIASPTVPLPTDATSQLLLGPWRPSPVDVPDDIRSSMEYVCRNPEDPALVETLADLPVAVVDARGGGLGTIVFADDSVAIECRLKLEMVGQALGATILEPPSWLDPGDLTGEAGISKTSDNLVTDDGGTRTVLIGRVGPDATRVIASFDDESEVVASQGSGWYTAWWPGQVRPGGVAAVDRASIVTSSVPDPHDEIEGRIGAARWWLDPAKPAPGPEATTIPALIQEVACASGQSPEGRVLEPAVFPSEAAVLVQVWVRKAPGPQDCQGNPEFVLEITLPQPVGDRQLLDGSEVPPRDATGPPN
jgi:hypothetical protein